MRLRRHVAPLKKMDDKSVCALLKAESDALFPTTISSHETSVTDADKVINTNTDSYQVEGEFCLKHAQIPPCGVQLADATLAVELSG